MPKINECLIDVDLANAIREVADALKLKVPAGKLGFRCPNAKCRQPVKPMVLAESKGRTLNISSEIRNAT